MGNPTQVGNPTQTVRWFVTVPVWEEFRELIAMIEETEEDSEEFHTLVEEIRALPNYPQGIDPEHAQIYPILTQHTVH